MSTGWEDGANSIAETLGRERLCQDGSDVCRPGAFAVRFEKDVRENGEGCMFGGRVPAHPSSEFNAVHAARQHDVEDDHVWSMPSGEGRSLRGLAGLEDSHSFVLEMLREQPPQISVILNKEYSRSH
jgi:hypothetical protein